ncbi:hypothetical protein SCA6_007366 [Theobroma cacao]
MEYSKCKCLRILRKPPSYNGIISHEIPSEISCLSSVKTGKVHAVHGTLAPRPLFSWGLSVESGTVRGGLIPQSLHPTAWSLLHINNILGFKQYAISIVLEPAIKEQEFEIMYVMSPCDLG